MTIFQFLLVAVVVIAAVFALRSVPGERSLALKRIIGLLFAAAAIASILFPSLLSTIANFFGIGRGADLLLYMFVLAALLYAVAAMRAKARSEARVTELARAVALMEARLHEEIAEQGADPSDDD